MERSDNQLPLTLTLFKNQFVSSCLALFQKLVSATNRRIVAGGEEQNESTCLFGRQRTSSCMYKIPMNYHRLFNALVLLEPWDLNAVAPVNPVSRLIREAGTCGIPKSILCLVCYYQSQRPGLNEMSCVKQHTLSIVTCCLCQWGQKCTL